MLAQFISHIFSDVFLLCCAAAMLLLFTFDFLGLIGRMVGLGEIRHFDFKTPIVSVGLFGTFFGVLEGLYGFDTTNISSSVPHLLEGLKFAFAISVLGMFLSLTLSVLEKFMGHVDDDAEILRSIDFKIGNLANSIESPQVLIQEFSEMKVFLKNHLEHINDSLDKALTQLAKGATKEVMQALERIITEFNDNLKSQFGENFKELNAACYKLVDWQDRYRIHVDATEAHLCEIIMSLDEARSAVNELVKRSEKTTEVCNEVGALIKTYDVQVTTLATYLEKCKELGAQASSFLANTEKAITLSSENLNAFSGIIERSVSKQSESLALLTKEIDQQVPKALGELEKVLTNITNQFASDYRSLFQFITDKR
ncbi:MAG: hypothetical protein QY326_08135 [Bdellovibrionota bacterium]|nr:MAG: hypothetical protein QY326_08135 [Bdellovibrionota bacterium]